MPGRRTSENRSVHRASATPRRRPQSRGCTRRWAAIASGLTALVLSACSGEPGVGEARYAIAEPGPWHIPAETTAIGDTQFVEYTGAGPWVGEQGCGGGLLQGTSLLRDYIMLYFSQAYSIGGYACRPIVGDSNSMSVHATGRALDVMIETVGGEADNSAGDVIGNWLIEHSELIGIQMIIWDRWIWNASLDPPKDHDYTGQHPHHDHLHVELSVDAAALGTPFFQNSMEPPDLISCGTIPAAGGIIDDSDTCAGFYGPAQYWRSAEVGHGGSLLWTNAFQGDDPSNWARWVIDVEAAGAYRAEVYLTPEYAVFDQVRYEIAHGGSTDAVVVDQGAVAEAGWYSLGSFDFAAGPGQHVSLYDNSAEPVADEQHIAFDALRLTPCAGGGCDDEGGEGSGLGGGCRAAPGGGSGPVAALLLLLALALRRRRSLC
jgi:MYXO-CTERM domain-containing protein